MGVLTTFWDPLPTLDITDRDPDIIYRVQIFKTICGQSILMSDDNVTESITSNSLSPLELMEIYSAIITPRNNVPGYVDGPKKVRIMYILSLTMSCIMHAGHYYVEKFMSLSGMTLFELSRRPPTIVTVCHVVILYCILDNNIYPENFTVLLRVSSQFLATIP